MEKIVHCSSDFKGQEFAINVVLAFARTTSGRLGASTIAVNALLRLR
ncbi:hypothetical protein [Bradyrhizobium iriomotense]|nr:hypothetical protein [Bradyrhizobium iriomotense]